MSSTPEAPAAIGWTGGWLGALRQLRYPPEFRIGMPEHRPWQTEGTAASGAGAVTPETPIGAAARAGSAASAGSVDQAGAAASDAATAPAPSDAPAGAAADAVADEVLAELATALWYLKTKFVRLAWSAPASEADDPRERRALRQVDRAAAGLADIGVEVDDPIGRRYPPGAEALMQALDYQPRADLEQDTVVQTVAPLVYRHGRIIRRAEVYVGIPEEPAAARP